MTYRNYDDKPVIHQIYKTQRQRVDLSFNNYLIDKYCVNRKRVKMDFWQIFSLLDHITDLSDPDTAMPNSLHALQTAEAIRATGNYPPWFVLCGLIHDMGKTIYTIGDPADGTSVDTQWAIVGDTYICGYHIPDEVVLPQYNCCNKDHLNPLPNDGRGLSVCSIAFGHDEFMYRLLVANNHKMPKEAEYIIRYHSMYLWHHTRAYQDMEDETDRKMRPLVTEFSHFDLYTKDDSNKVVWTPELTNYYTELVKTYISEDLNIWF